jgi:predicted ribosomally synthesized peptide with SipW-like signal peptide
MKRILYSISGIVVVAAVVIASTGAFFSDTETSTGNVFTAGAIDLQIDSQQHYNGNVCSPVTPPQGGPVVDYVWVGNALYPVPGSSCTGTWPLQDLGHGDVVSPKFFNFGDIKPGDEGENTISIHVINNDAWVCAAVANLTNDDNSQTEPEALVDANGQTTGELQQNMNWTIWRDDASTNGAVPGDNIQQQGEQVLASGHPVNGTLALYDSTTGTPLAGGTTGYIGVSWSLPGATGNEVQTDSMTGDISFSVVQSRNNMDYRCGQTQEEPTVAASYETGFEPSTFSIGNINGQDGWMKTGLYDAAVVNNPVINDLQSLRISNAVTSGAFGDQTFAPLLSSGAGETGVASNKHFEAQFNLASVLSSLQPGLAISVSPDNGSGARMSYLSFADEAGGIRVTFYDVTDAGPLSTVASFNPTDLGLISRSSHTIKFVMDFVDGQANDVVKIYIDNVLVKTGTSWEDYYRFDPEQAGSGNVLSPVKTLIFRAGGTAVPANAGNGFLFDKVSLWSGSL